MDNIIENIVIIYGVIVKARSATSITDLCKAGTIIGMWNRYI